jgi:Tol biopolymer transport system component
MRKLQFLGALALLALVLTNTRVVTVAGRQDAIFAERAKVVDTALAQSDLFDCATYIPDSRPVHPPESTVFHVDSDVKITPDDGKTRLGAVWSPKGDSMVFVAPTDDYREILNHDALPSDEDTQLVAVSKNELTLYSPASHTWEKITSDGGRPKWSNNGQNIYYLAGADLMKFDLAAKAATPAGLSAPNTGVGLLLSQPLPDGSLLAPRQSHDPLDVLGGKAPDWRQISVTENDHVVLSPQGDQIAVAYGANTWKGQFTPAVTVIHHANGKTTSLLKNCQFSATEMVWSLDGNHVAYPVHAEHSEIRIFDVQSGQTQVLIRLETDDLLSGLSWSPDGKYLAFTLGDDRTTPRSIWLVSTDGTVQQRLVEGGLLPNWSPDGKRILYARPDARQLLEWHLLEVSPAIQQKGVNLQ